MSKSVLVIDTPENCYDCPFGTAYCGELEYVGYCELADCLDYDVILMTEEHYDCESKSRPDWCPLKPLPEKMTGVASTDHWDRIKAGWNGCINKITGRIFECSENGKASGIHMGERKPFKPYRNSVSKHIEFLRQ